MHEHIGGSVIGSDKTVALFDVEPLDCASVSVTHCQLPSLCRSGNKYRASTRTATIYANVKGLLQESTWRCHKVQEKSSCADERGSSTQRDYNITRTLKRY